MLIQIPFLGTINKAPPLKVRGISVFEHGVSSYLITASAIAALISILAN